MDSIFPSVLVVHIDASSFGQPSPPEPNLWVIGAYKPHRDGNMAAINGELGVQCFLGYVTVYQFLPNLRNGNKFCIYFVWVTLTLIKIANTPLNRSAALVLSVIN